MAEIVTIGLDIAKSVFQVHGVDAAGQVVVRRQLRRSLVLRFFAGLAPCIVGVEACATSAAGPGTQREVDAAVVREALRQAAKKRHGRCRSDLRGGDAADDAVRRDQDTRTAERTDAASHPADAGVPADNAEQHDPRPHGGVRHRGADRPAWARRAVGGSLRPRRCADAGVGARLPGRGRRTAIARQREDPRHGSPDRGVPSLQRYEPPAGGDPGHWPAARDRPGCDGA